MKRYLASALALVLLLTGCGDGSNSDEDISLPPESEATVAPEPEPEPEPEEPSSNYALLAVDGMEALGEEHLAGIKTYGQDMQWFEARQIPGLERWGEGGDFTLVVPREAGATVQLLDEADAVLYETSSTPEHYALLLRSEADSPSRVVVRQNDTTAEYALDGASPVSGALLVVAHEPREAVVPADDVVATEGRFFAPDDARVYGDGDFLRFRMNVPTAWTEGAGNDEQYFDWDGQEVRVWAYNITADGAVNPLSFLAFGDGVVELPGPDELYRTRYTQCVSYSFVRGDLVVVADLYIEAGGEDWDTLDAWLTAAALSFEILESERGIVELET